MDKTPFRALLHDGSFVNLAFQPARDWVGCSGRADMARLRTSYHDKLIGDGYTPEEATRKVALVRGGITVMVEQFEVMGLGSGAVLTDTQQLKRSWEMAQRVGHVLGQRVGAEPRVRTPKAYVPRTTMYDHIKQGPQYSEVVALADKIGDEVDKKRRRRA